MKFETNCVTIPSDPQTGESHIQPIYQSSSYLFNNLQDGIEIFAAEKEGYVYSRYGHPNADSLSNKLASLEMSGTNLRASALFTNSGMSAIHALCTSLCHTGETILSAHDLYGGSSDLFATYPQKFGIAIEEIDFAELEEVEKVIQHKSPRIVFLESPSNPLLHCYDIRKIAAICKSVGCYLVIDNTFCTPYVQQPIQFGADFVIYSTTKYLNGHGNALGGAIISTHTEFMTQSVLPTIRLQGATISPMDAWLLQQGIKTLALRMKKQMENAHRIANFLQDHPFIERVYYPGLPSHASHSIASSQMNGYGAMISFCLRINVHHFADSLEVINVAPTLGDVHSIILHPASMSHRNMPKDMREKYGISDQMIRLSVGIEHADDLIQDLSRALRNTA